VVVSGDGEGGGGRGVNLSGSNGCGSGIGCGYDNLAIHHAPLANGIGVYWKRD
jgi:hypothetical protein